MTSLDVYLTEDHSARRLVMFFGVVFGAATGALGELAGYSLTAAVIATFVATGTIEVIGAFGYSASRRKVQKWAPSVYVRRALMQIAFAAVAMTALFWVRIPRMEGWLFERKLERAAANPASPQSMKEAKEALQRSGNENVQLKPGVVQRTGVRFVQAARTEPRAWDTALDFLSYRTSLNPNLVAYANAAQIATTSSSPEFVTHYQANIPPGYANPDATVGGNVPADLAADIHFLNKPSYNEGQQRGRQVILLENGGFTLDGLFLRSVVFRNVTIVYSGGPVQLENVIFVNCTFVMQNGAQQRNFADAILLSESTTSFTA